MKNLFKSNLKKRFRFLFTVLFLFSIFLFSVFSSTSSACRMYGAISNDLPNGLLQQHLIDDPNCLYYLANPSNYDNIDGWGIAYYSPGVLVDSSFDTNESDDDLRDTESPGEYWYESRGDDPSMLTLDETVVGGNDTKKAKLTGSTSGNAYLSQEFPSSQNGIFSIQWGIYVDEIIDSSDPDRSAYMFIGDDADGIRGPNSTNDDRFVYMAFYKEGGGTDGTMNLVARQPADGWTGGSFTQIATELNLDQWYTIKVEVDVPNNTYDIYLDGVLVGDDIQARLPKTSLTHISFATFNDGPGTFCVDNVGNVTMERDADSAYRDLNGHYSTVVNSINATEPVITIAHIRDCTSGCCDSGNFTIENPHPFYRDKNGKKWTFTHNGGVSKSRLETLLGDYLTDNPPNGSGVPACDPSNPNLVVDSELYFLFILKKIEENGWNSVNGIVDALNTMIDDGETGGMNFLMSDGTTLWGFCRGRTLDFLDGSASGYSAVASQYPSSSRGDWEALDDNDLVVLTVDGPPQIFDVTDYTPVEEDLIVDCDFELNLDDDDLRDTDSPGEYWYESRGQAPALLYLDESNIDGNDTKKAGFTASTSGNAYVSQEFSTAQNGIFSAQWDMYLDNILDTGNYDRAGFMLLGDDANGVDGPNSTSSDRFVFMAFYCEDGCETGTANLIAREPGDSYSDSTAWRIVAPGVELDQWHSIRVVCDVDLDTYDVYVDGDLLDSGVQAYTSKTAVTHISFAQWNDGAGAFYVDNVSATTEDEMFLLDVNVSGTGSGTVEKDPDKVSYDSGETVILTAFPEANAEFVGWSGDVPASQENDNPLELIMDDDKTVTANFDMALSDLVFDSDFELNISDDDLRDTDSPGKYWYESRGDDPNMLTLDETAVGGNDTKKAKLTGSTSGNAYLTQEFTSPQSEIFSIQWDIYVDEIINSSSPDRSAYMLIGDDANGTDGPNSTNGDRFVYMALYKEGGGTDGTMDLVARQPGDNWSGGSFTQIATGLDLAQWHTIMVEVDVPNDTYDVYLNGVLVGDDITARVTKTSLTDISFATWNDGPGTFYVDNVREYVDIPDLRVSPTYLEFGPDLDTLSFMVENSGDAPFDWTAFTDETWIVGIDPESGTTLNPGESIPVTVTIDRAILSTALPDTNCRMWGAISTDGIQGDVITSDLITDSNSLKTLTSSTQNNDGWSVGYYSNFGDKPFIARGPEYASHSGAYDNAVNLMATTNPHIALGHVRNCTSGCCDDGNETINNPHPFYRNMNGKTWLFQHNGNISKTSLRNLIGEDYLAENPPNGSNISQCDPANPDLVVDSELYFLLLLKNIEESNLSVEQGIIDVVSTSIIQDTTANFIMSDGYTIWAYRGGHDLAFYYDEVAGYSVVASEPPGDGADWTIMEDDQLVILRPGEAPTVIDINQFPELRTGSIHVMNTSSGESTSVLVSAESLPSDPTFISITPNDLTSTVGEPVNFTLTVGDGDGYEDFYRIYIGINESNGTIIYEELLFRYYEGAFHMWDHAEGQWNSATPGQSVIFEDDLCSMDISQCNVTGSGDILTINLNITPKEGFIEDPFGNSKKIWLELKDHQHTIIRNIEVGTWNIVPPPPRTLTIGVDQSVGGTTNPAPGEHTYSEGDVVTITAIADLGYRFANWTGNVADPLSASTTVTIDGDETVTASFVSVPTHTLTMNIDPLGGGTTNPSTGVHTYSEGEEVAITAIAEFGYQFVSWAGDVADQYSATTTVTIDGDKTVAAVFEIATYTLTMDIDPSGWGTTNPAPGDHTYSEGDVVTITAIAESGYQFVSWDGDVDDPYSVTTTTMIDGDKTVTAIFEIVTHTLTMDIDPLGGGTTDPAPGDHTYSEGDVVTITAIAESGYQFVSWAGDVADQYSVTTTAMIDGDKTVTAVFEIVTHTLTIDIDPLGGGTTDPAPGEHPYSEGEEVIITAIAESGYQFVSWTGDVADPFSVTTTVMINEEKTVTAIFEIVTHTLTIDIDPSGGGTTDPVPGAYTYSEGDEVTITVTANPGYVFISWAGDVTDQYSATTAVILNEDKTVTASFEFDILSFILAALNGEKEDKNWWDCFIATAAYGSPLEKEVDILRHFRDKFLKTNQLGKAFVDLYYTYSPPIAKYISKHDTIRLFVRIGLYPIVRFSSFMLETSILQKIMTSMLFSVMFFAGMFLFRKRKKITNKWWNMRQLFTSRVQ